MLGSRNGVVTPQDLGCTFIHKWLHLLQDDRVEEVRTILNNSDEGTKKFLLEGTFPEWQFPPCGHDSGDCYGNELRMKLLPRSTLSSTISSASIKILKLLINQGIAYHLPENKANIIHYILYCAFSCQSQQNKYLLFYRSFVKQLTADALRNLLQELNPTGLNALEIAAKLGVYTLFDEILNTKGVYLMKQGGCLGMSYMWYDVTDYEHPNGKRQRFSPLNIFMLYSTEDMEDETTRDFLNGQVIQQWFCRRFKSLRWFTLLIFIAITLRILIHVVTSNSCLSTKVFFPNYYMQYQEAAKNKSADPLEWLNVCMKFPFALDIFFCTVSLLISLFLLPIYLFFGQCTRKQYEKLTSLKAVFNKSQPILGSTRYYAINFIFELTVVVRTTLLLIGSCAPLSVSEELVSILDIMATFYYILAVLYFIQMTPFGYHVTTIQRMHSDLKNFIIILIVIQFSFASIFYRIITVYGTTEGVPDFRTYLRSLYGINILMVSTGSLAETEKPLLCFLHVLYILFVSIQIINLLIAVFSKSVAKLSAYREHVLMFQRNLIAYDTYMMVAAPLRKLHLFSVKRHFAHEGDKIYLVVVRYDPCPSYQVIHYGCDSP